MQQFTLGFLPPATMEEAAHRLQQSQGDEHALLVYARSCLLAYDSALRYGDLADATTQEAAIEQVAIALNGGSRHGMAGGTGGLTRLGAALRAEDNTTPLWGQPGVFQVTLIAGCRVRVEYHGLTGLHHPTFHAHVVDLDQPFLSETGFRSFSDQHHRWPPPCGLDVRSWCRESMDAYVVSKDQYKKPGLVALIPRCARCGHMQDYHRPERAHCLGCDCPAFVPITTKEEPVCLS